MYYDNLKTYKKYLFYVQKYLSLIVTLVFDMLKKCSFEKTIMFICFFKILLCKVQRFQENN